MGRVSPEAGCAAVIWRSSRLRTRLLALRLQTDRAAIQIDMSALGRFLITEKEADIAPFTFKVDILLRHANRISEAEPEAMPLFARFARWVERQVGRSSTFLLAIAVVVLCAAGPVAVADRGYPGLARARG